MQQTLVALVALAALQLATAASAAVVFYTERSAWEAAVGLPTFGEDFSGFASDTSFQSSPVQLDGFTIEQVGLGDFRNEIDAAPFDFSEHDGTPHASLFTNAPGGSSGEVQVQIVFDQTNLAFGFESWVAADQEGARLEIYDGVALVGSQDLSNDFGGFLGYLLDGGDSATAVVFRSIDSITGPGDPGEGFGLDELAGVAVPEPASAGLLALGLSLLARAPRRK